MLDVRKSPVPNKHLTISFTKDATLANYLRLHWTENNFKHAIVCNSETLPIWMTGFIQYQIFLCFMLTYLFSRWGALGLKHAVCDFTFILLLNFIFKYIKSWALAGGRVGASTPSVYLSVCSFRHSLVPPRRVMVSCFETAIRLAQRLMYRYLFIGLCLLPVVARWTCLWSTNRTFISWGLISATFIIR